jgi:hypothetical protein
MLNVECSMLNVEWRVAARSLIQHSTFNTQHSTFVPIREANQYRDVDRAVPSARLGREVPGGEGLRSEMLNVECSMLNVEWTVAARSLIQHSTFNTQHSTFVPICEANQYRDVDRAVPSVRLGREVPGGEGLRSEMLNVEWTVAARSLIQHSTFNTQHSTFVPGGRA